MSSIFCESWTIRQMRKIPRKSKSKQTNKQALQPTTSNMLWITPSEISSKESVSKLSSKIPDHPSQPNPHKAKIPPWICSTISILGWSSYCLQVGTRTMVISQLAKLHGDTHHPTSFVCHDASSSKEPPHYPSLEQKNTLTVGDGCFSASVDPSPKSPSTQRESLAAGPKTTRPQLSMGLCSTTPRSSGCRSANSTVGPVPMERPKRMIPGGVLSGLGPWKTPSIWGVVLRGNPDPNLTHTFFASFF